MKLVYGTGKCCFKKGVVLTQAPQFTKRDVVQNTISVHQDKSTVPTIVLQTVNSDKNKYWLKRKKS